MRFCTTTAEIFSLVCKYTQLQTKLHYELPKNIRKYIDVF